jgi:hypothetical protein
LVVGQLEGAVVGVGAWLVSTCSKLWTRSPHLHKAEADVIRARAGFTFAARADHVA